ncbi:unnamed protein product [Rotaria sp. Silwood1]|nr:unnamed protein product [Rotaria sp. Silwood1]
MGVLRQKCVPTYESFLNNSNLYNIGFNMTYKVYLKEIDNETYWHKENDIFLLCGNESGSTKCPPGYVCWKNRGKNPDFGYTSFDNYGWAMLACFRLMTQDYWENLYQLILSAVGRYHFLYFVAAIFFGSYYLLNLILAIVFMSYQQQQKQVEIENEERKRRKTRDKLEIQNEEIRKTSEIQTLSHVENVQCFEDLNRKISSHKSVSIEYEQNGKTNELNKSSFILSDATIIPFIDETQQNSANEDRKSQRTNSDPYLSERNQNDNDTTITLYQDRSHIKYTPITEVLPAQELDRISVRSKNMDTNNTCNRTLVKLLRIYCWEWSCESSIFRKFQDAIAFFILDAFVDLFIAICIILNTLFMALDQPGQSEKMTRILTAGNYIFTSIFVAEFILKIIALTPVKFLKNGWNVFDLLIITGSLIELCLADINGLSVLRLFRLLRVFKLAKSWQTLNRLLTIIGISIGALGNLTLVLIIIIFMFAVMGMQLFGDKYANKFGKNMPRWNFFDFFHAFMIVFRVLCGEWIESMWICLECAGWPCIPFFLLTFVVEVTEESTKIPNDDENTDIFEEQQQANITLLPACLTASTSTVSTMNNATLLSTTNLLHTPSVPNATSDINTSSGPTENLELVNSMQDQLTFMAQQLMKISSSIENIQLEKNNKASSSPSQQDEIEQLFENITCSDDSFNLKCLEINYQLDMIICISCCT